MALKTEMYCLSPVEVVKVNSANLEEVAQWCGGHVGTTESKRVPGRMDSYVWVPTPNGAAISWAFPGIFITKRLVNTVKGEQKITYAVFRRDYFEKNYFSSPAVALAETWDKPRKATTVVDNAPHLTQAASAGVRPAEPRKGKKAKKPSEYLSSHERQQKPSDAVQELVASGEVIPDGVTMATVVQVLEDAGIHATEIQPTPEEPVDADVVEGHQEQIAQAVYTSETDPITVEDIALNVIAGEGSLTGEDTVGDNGIEYMGPNSDNRH